MYQILHVIITVLSYAFQISGAAILLIWCLKGSDKQIKQSCVEQHSGPLWLNFDNTTTLPKEDLQQTAKVLYQNICAFADLLIGYTCAIFVQNTGVSSWLIFIFVAIVTIIIIAVENIISHKKALRKYPTDQKVNLADLQIKKNTEFWEEVSGMQQDEDHFS